MLLPGDRTTGKFFMRWRRVPSGTVSASPPLFLVSHRRNGLGGPFRLGYIAPLPRMSANPLLLEGTPLRGLSDQLMPIEG